MTTPIWIEEAVTIAIYRRQLAEHSGIEGIRDRGLLQSALSIPRNKFVYSKSTIFDLAAAYGCGITKNHPFIDGNKRTSYVVMRTFLRLNNYDIQASAREKYEVWICLANNRLSEAELAQWIEGKAVKHK